VSPRISVVVPCYNEDESIFGFLDRLFDSVTLPCEVLAVYDMPEDTTVPLLERYAERSRGSSRRTTPTAAGRPTPCTTASTTPQAT